MLPFFHYATSFGRDVYFFHHFVSISERETTPFAFVVFMFCTDYIICYIYVKTIMYMDNNDHDDSLVVSLTP